MHTLRFGVLVVHGIAGDAGMGVDGGCILGAERCMRVVDWRPSVACLWPMYRARCCWWMHDVGVLGVVGKR